MNNHYMLLGIPQTVTAPEIKKLVKSHLIKEIIDKKEWYTSKPWYTFVDPYEHLKGYKIMDLAKDHGIVY